ncbi:MAG: hypothetical protein ABI651_19975 [Verrucomicrobiota bacterium]
MIRPLRRRHRVMVCTLGVLLPFVFVAGIAARRPVPVARSVPVELESKLSDFGTVVWTKADLLPGQRIITSLRRNAASLVAVTFMFRDLAKPDVLVYWATGKGTAVEGLPDNARLLGALSNGVPLPIPAAARGEAGRVVLYSLADHEVVATSKPLTL